MDTNRNATSSRYGVDIAFHNVPVFRLHLVITTTEIHNLRVRIPSRNLPKVVHVQSTTGHHVLGLDDLLGSILSRLDSCNLDHLAARPFHGIERCHLIPQVQGAPSRLRILGQRTGHVPEVNDASVWGLECRIHVDIGFYLPDLLTCQDFQTLHTVGCASAVQLLHLGVSLLSRCTDEFPDAFMRNSFLLCILVHHPGTVHTTLCHDSTRLIIHACVNDATVMTALVRSDFRFLLQDRDSFVRKASQDLVGCRQADDSTADHCDIVAAVLHPGLRQPSSMYRFQRRTT
mmetsp:Transcript_10362/g.28882  ORF Transcript_10362/g.28882 Transcript_10362/m.28882 type:complete len:288 (+) Transcript_10362:600-1463(+)